MRKINAIQPASHDVGKPKTAPAVVHRELTLKVLMKFRLVINSAKRHYKWVETQCGINGAQLWALSEVQQNPGMSVSELAAAMAVHQSTVSNLLDRLEKSRLIKRDRTGKDQRVVRLSVTDAGRALVRQAPKPARGMLPEALHRLPDAALRSLDARLESLLAEMRPGEKGSMHRPLADTLFSR